MTLICVRAVSGEDRRMPPIPAQEVDSGGEAEEAQLEVATVRAARAGTREDLLGTGARVSFPRWCPVSHLAGNATPTG